MTHIKLRNSYDSSNTLDILRFIADMEKAIEKARSFIVPPASDSVYDIGFSADQFRQMALAMGLNTYAVGRVINTLFETAQANPRTYIYIGDLAAIYGRTKWSHERYGDEGVARYSHGYSGYYSHFIYGGFRIKKRECIQGFKDLSMEVVLKILEHHSVRPNSTPEDWKPPIP